ncbi:hypothetical protein T11_17742 [Trichinella zimbabwensis]|uniref:Uncharacterized protein n=1 Tax=Trichinella zimbabwensis TaxID=268475 RepID=A0A0V1GNQ3_9BILA|nr:hypothetical protein T11_17742 [Trichinella zimbabwensis]
MSIEAPSSATQRKSIGKHGFQRPMPLKPYFKENQPQYEKIHNPKAGVRHVNQANVRPAIDNNAMPR